MKRLISLTVLLLTLALVFAACAQPAQQTTAPTAAPAAKATEAPKQAVAPTTAPAVPTAAPAAKATDAPAAKTTSAAPAATTAPSAAGQAQIQFTPSAPGKKGGKVTAAIWQEPDVLNPLLSSLTVTGEVTYSVIEGLADVDPNGNYYPRLAKEIPDQSNGGVSADGKTVTWKLKDGVKWSDGSAFTCEDVKFTWQARMTPNVGVIDTVGFRDIDSLDCPDPLTAVVKYKTIYAAYRGNFGTILPKSAGDPTKMKDWAYNTKPLGTGPFKVDEFQRGSFIALSKNPNYREQGKPNLDQLIFRIVPSSEVAKQLLRSGEVDVMWNNTEADYPELQTIPGLKISDPVQNGGERLILNLTKPGEPSDNKTPHPILGDLKVRQGIAYGINKQQIIDKLLFGKALPGSGEQNAGFFNCGVAPFPFDPQKAASLLEEAGWKVGPNGIRTKDGQPLRIKYQTTTGNKLREDSQVLIVEDMKKIGVEFYIENQPSQLLIGSWANKSPRKYGNFDIIMYTTNGGVDPNSQMTNYFHSSSIPSEQNQGGVNYSRWNDPQTDKDITEAAQIVDLNKRKELYCDAVKRVVDGASHIYLYQRRSIQSARDYVQNFQSNPWASAFTWNAQDWWVSK